MKNPEELLLALDPEQQQVALQTRGPLCVRAGAGTGKTRAITYRIAYGAASGEVDPNGILAVTFTTRAAAEMRSRLRGLGVPVVQARTFHSAALRQLRYFWGHAFGGQCPEVKSSKASTIAAAAARIGIKVDKTMVRDLAAEVEWAKVSMLTAQSYPQRCLQIGRTPPGVSVEEFLKLYDAYEQAKIEQNVIDFEDVLALTCGLFTEHEEIAQTIRRQYRSFVVDEYQDVSALQHRLLTLWRGGRNDICVVGDVAQTIYSFAGADPRFLIDFHKEFPAAHTVELNRDYRSTPQVVSIANQVMARARGIDGVGPEKGLPGAVQLISQEESGPAVSFATYPTDEVEAGEVAARVKELNDAGVQLSQIAILYRTNAQSEAYEQALSALGFGVQVHGGARFFDREEVRRAVVMLRQAERIAALADTEPEGSLEEQVTQVVSGLGWSPTAPHVSGLVRERWENLDALVALARSRPDFTLSNFVAELQERAESQAAPQVNGVVLSTLHAAKGLEWEAVFLVGMSEGLMPISLAESPQSIEEERRLLYVGITRAKRHLQLSWSRSRGAGRSSSRKVSRFLESMWPSDTPHREHAKKIASTPRKRRLDAIQKFEEEADEQAKALFEELRQWRLGVAKEKSLPPFAVLTDVSLRQIALARPRTLRQLLLIRGIGDTKLADYGPAILELVRDTTHQ